MAGAVAAPPPPALDPAVFNRAFYNSILDFWFADIPEGATIPEFSFTKRWFGLFDDPADKHAFDTACQQLAAAGLAALGPARYPLPAFTSFATERANAAALSAPLRESIARASAQGDGRPLPLPHATLAVLLLLDQFTRNTLRDPAGQAVVYGHYDRLARALVHYLFDETHRHDPLCGIDRDPLVQHDLVRRPFFYLPLEHSEDLADHDLSNERHLDLWRDGSEPEKAFVANSADFERRHRVILERFGRYPHRNSALGRESTAEEERFMAEGGDTFGAAQKKD